MLFYRTFSYSYLCISCIATLWLRRQRAAIHPAECYNVTTETSESVTLAINDFKPQIVSKAKTIFRIAFKIEVNYTFFNHS